ncbi:MAG: metallophosphoesterase family protein, partial [Bacteroidota bacterium]
MNTFQKIARPERGTRWVIPDIHGCALTFEYLVKDIIRLKNEDHLYLLGDYVDRGPRSAEVIDFILSLKNQGYQVYPLRGNHDHDLLENWIYYKEVKSISHYEGFLNLMESNRTLDLVDEFGRMHPAYEHFLKELPYYYELPDYFLVHAGFNFNSPLPFEDLESMIWSRHLLRRKAEGLYRQQRLCDWRADGRTR